MKVYRKEVLALEINQQELDAMKGALGDCDTDTVAYEMYCNLPSNVEDADEE